ncbi:MAG: DUF3037 domain-containing protein [Wenzhouxiangella sp.]
MNRIACQYAIVRFAPFVETGEFANVGVLMMAPHDRFFAFKLETRRFARITRFFEQLDRKHYLRALRRLQDELERVHELLKAHGFDRRRKQVDLDLAQRMFTEIIRPRESTVRFSEPRVVLADNPAEKLDELFGFYVERNFVTKEYRERLLEKNVRDWLFQAQIADRFSEQVIGDQAYPQKFPFVEMAETTAVKIIKPLDLGQSEAKGILDRGGIWVYRVQQLRHRGHLPERLLFPVAGPDKPTKLQREAFRESVAQLENAGINVVGADERERILEFARPH